MSTLLFAFTKIDGILKIVEPGEYAEVYKGIWIKDAQLMDEHHSVIKLYNCRINELHTRSSVVLDHCKIGTVKAEGDILCLASKIGTLQTQGKIAIQSKAQVAKVKSASKLYIFGNTEIRCPKIETPDYHLYTDCRFGFTSCGPKSITDIAYTFHLSYPLTV